MLLGENGYSNFWEKEEDISASIDKKINDAYIEIGKMSVQMFGNNPPKEMEDTFRRLAAVQKEKDDYENHKKNFPAQEVQYRNPEWKSTNHKRICLNCGNLIQADMRFCTSCGTPVEEIPERSSDVPEHEEAFAERNQSGAASALHVVLPQKPRIYNPDATIQVSMLCPNCGRRIRANSIVCSFCGKAVKRISMDEPDQQYNKEKNSVDDRDSVENFEIETPQNKGELLDQEENSIKELQKNTENLDKESERLTEEQPENKTEESAAEQQSGVQEFLLIEQPENKAKALAAADHVLYCQNCGSEIQEDALFCIECGQPITEKTEESVSEPPVSESSADAVDNTIMHCTNCGSEIQEDALFCTECGQPVVRNKEETDEPAVPHFCPNCGKRTEEDALFCTECGTPLS